MGKKWLFDDNIRYFIRALIKLRMYISNYLKMERFKIILS